MQGIVKGWYPSWKRKNPGAKDIQVVPRLTENIKENKSSEQQTYEVLW